MKIELYENEEHKYRIFTCIAKSSENASLLIEILNFDSNTFWYL